MWSEPVLISDMAQPAVLVPHYGISSVLLSLGHEYEASRG